MFTRFSPQTARYPNRTTFPHTIGHLFCIKKKNKRSPWSGTTRDDSRFSNNNNLLKVGKSLLKFNNFVLLSAAPSSEYLNYQTPTWIHRPSWLSPRECARTSPPACYDQQLTMTEGLSTAKVAAGSSHAKSIPIGKVFFCFVCCFVECVIIVACWVLWFSRLAYALSRVEWADRKFPFIGWKKDNLTGDFFFVRWWAINWGMFTTITCFSVFCFGLKWEGIAGKGWK